jgi:O-antigen ligase
MSIRVIVCFLFVIGYSLYAYRNWFASLCATVFLMAFVKHPDMPRTILGIPGMNMWNLLMGNVLLAWWIERRHEGLGGDMPRSLKIALRLYFAIVIISFLRFFINPTGYYTGTRVDIVLDYFLNSIRFLLPAYLFYDGCRTDKRIVMALGSIVLLYFLLSIQVIRYMGLHPDFSGSELSGRAARIVQHSVGYDRVDMSMMLSGASWAALALSNVMEKKWHRWALRGSALVIVFGQALTGGRTGYATWGLIGLVLCTLRWRKLLPLIPMAAMAIVLLMPSVAERMLAGFGGQSDGIVIHQDDSEITSGRNLVWPAVIAKIKQGPWIGYGRLAMVRTGLTDWARDELGDQFQHPHEAYLEMLLDNGIIGFLCILPLYFIALKTGVSLFFDRTERLYEAAGAVALALLLALLFASFGAQTLYPREGVVGMWAAIGVAMRVSVERERKRWQDDAATVEVAGTADEVEEMNHVGSARVALGGA